MSLARAIGRNTFYAGLGRLTVLLVWFLATPSVLAALGGDRFGFWSILLVLTGSLATLDLGLGVAVSRFVAELEGRGAHDGIASLVRRALLLQLGFAALLVVPGLLFRNALLDLFRVPAAWRPEAHGALTIAFFGFALGMATNLFTAALQGLQRMDLAARAMIPAAVALLLGILLAARSARPLWALTVVQAAYFGVMALLLAWLLRIAIGQARGSGSVPGGRGHISLPRLISLGSWVQASSILGLVQAHVDKLLLGALVALTPVAAYEIGARVSAVAVLLPMLFLTALLPALAHHESSGRESSRLAIYREAVGPFLVLSLGIVGALIALAPALLEAWLRTPPPTAVFMLRMLALAAVATLSTGVASTMVRAADRASMETAYGLLNAVLHITLSVVGLRLFGWPGILYGTVIAAFVTGAWFLGRVERWLGGRPLRESLAAGLPAIVASGAAILLATFAVGWFRGMEPGRERGLVSLGAAGGLYAIVFVGVLAIAFPVTWRSLVQRGLAILRR